MKLFVAGRKISLKSRQNKNEILNTLPIKKISEAGVSLVFSPASVCNIRVYSPKKIEQKRNTKIQIVLIHFPSKVNLLSIVLPQCR
jgi:hypothetical protein